MDFKDVVESVHRLYESKDKNVLGTLEFSWGKSDDENKNGRTYPHKVFAPAVKALGIKIESAKVPGQSDHPLDGGGTRLSDVSHILTKVWMDGTTAMARANLLNTDAGRNTLRVIESGVRIGASLRGMGEVKGGKVQPGLEVKTVDLVVDPSFTIASIDQSNVIESYIPEEYQFTEGDLENVTEAMDTLSDEEVEGIKVMLEKDGAVWEKRHIKALPLWIKERKGNSNLPGFFGWFREQVEKFSGKNDGIIKEDNFRKSALLEEKQMAGNFTGYSRDRLKRIEQRQKEIDEALSNSKYDRLTISRLFAEAIEAGFKGDKKEFIEQFGF